MSDTPSAFPPLRDASQIFDLDDFDYELVAVPEWQLTVLVRSFSMAEWDRVMGSSRETAAAIDKGEAVDRSSLTLEAAELLCSVILNPETKKPVLDAGVWAPKLLGRSHKPALRLFNCAIRMSAMTAEAIDTTGKDSAPTPSGASSSSSSEPSDTPPATS